MQGIVTLTEQKEREVVRHQQAVAALVPVVASYARSYGGWFLLFGSAARGQMKDHSGVDLLTDFPEEALNRAWTFAEEACWDLGLEPDLLPYGGCKPKFLDHIAAESKVLG